VNDDSVKKLVLEQMKQWSEMVERHRKEVWSLMKTQVTEQQDTLNKLMETIQASQVKQVEAKHERCVLFSLKVLFTVLIYLYKKIMLSIHSFTH
jgi:hypothetical protein